MKPWDVIGSLGVNMVENVLKIRYLSPADSGIDAHLCGINVYLATAAKKNLGRFSFFLCLLSYRNAAREQVTLESHKHRHFRQCFKINVHFTTEES